MTFCCSYLYLYFIRNYVRLLVVYSFTKYEFKNRDMTRIHRRDWLNMDRNMTEFTVSYD